MPTCQQGWNDDFHWPKSRSSAGLDIDLKIREDGVLPDRPFSKGLISIDGRVLSREEDVVVRSEILESWLSTRK